MSRIGKEPISIPAGVEVKTETSQVRIKGPKGELMVDLHPKIKLAVEGNIIQLDKLDNTRIAREQWGLRRSLVNNAVVGVSKGFEKTLEVVGVGYKVDLQGKTIVLNVGFSHPVKIDLPKSVNAKVDKNKITLSGIDKQEVGELAAVIRRIRPPEPYKGKGIKYENEQIRRKAGKSGGK
ncbi:50S ribosomal protein L6 [Desulfonatronovibrio hydrogenovorans]|uniref:50S ribosomal protein L6 n=1 Tax=Desulfonatronovibrio hydrogenovorans TaxID=53245 RepID=UPI00048DC68B|nr:50S ribosomal protein L6 [Desulfonatronovibrio hydrogenovorans]